MEKTELLEEKTRLINRLNNIIEQLQKTERTLGFLILFLNVISKKIDLIISECLTLEREILSNTDGLSIERFHSYKKNVIELERKTTNLKMRSGFLPSFLIAYFGFAIIFYILIKVDIIKFIVETLGVEAPEKLIIIGVSGAFLFIATKFLEKQENIHNTGTNFGVYLVRITLAIIVPIILVILFFDKDGKIQEFNFTPEMLSFACGYSSSLVIGIFNKIVDKGRKMIEAI